VRAAALQNPLSRRLLQPVVRRRGGPSWAGAALVAAFADAYPAAFFIEIGANDGTGFDHLRPAILNSSWTGIMVEPVPYVFERLRRNYGQHPRVVLENAAIAAHDGHQPFYHLEEVADFQREGLPGWYHQIGSFSKDFVLSHARHIADIDQRLTCTEVPCLTFESLCQKHKVERLDLVAIDAEGFDAEIVKLIDLARRHPRLILYEHYHLSPADRKFCRSRLAEAGYETMEEHFDTWGLQTGNDSLTAMWRDLRPAFPGVSVHDEH
jgi:FkbM family methyltransferase